MQIKINLLPPELRARRDLKSRQHKTLLIGALVLAVFLCIYGVLFAVTLSVKMEARDLEQQRQELEVKIRELQPYAEQLAKTEKVENMSRQAMGTNPDWARVVRDLGLYTPSNIWLTDLTATVGKGQDQQSSPAGNGELLLRGWALDHISVATWIEEIDLIPGLGEARCQFSEEKTEGNTAAINFEVKAAVLPGQGFQAFGKAGE